MDTGKSKQRDFLVPEFVHSGRDMRARVSDKTRLKRLAAAVCAGLMAGAFSFLPMVEARGGGFLPTLDSKDAAVSIVTNGNVMDINSAATNNVIKWVDFSISNSNTVDFHDQNYLNYVTGSARSDIYGIMKGTGNIYLVNPNGILIGDTARIDVGNLYLSTRNLTDDQLADFTARGTNPLYRGTLTGDVINLGQLDANTVTVEGNNITFKNVAEVTKGATLGNDGKLTGGAVNTNVTMTASDTGEIHLGVAVGPEATSVNDEQYKNVSLSIPTGWEVNKTADEAMYMLVHNKYELQNMQNNLSGKYMLAGDIDMSGVSFTPVGYSVYNPQTGEDEDNYAFKGRFDGLGYAVKNLSVNFNYEVSNDPGAYNKSGIGLFGWNKGMVENVKLSGGSIESTQGRIGIIGINDGTVRNVFNDGVTVTGTYNVGGIVGFNDTGTIKNVWNTGTVSGSSYVGGIAGNNYASIENAWNNGSVSGSEDSVGGIVGNNQDGIVQNVYNTGAVQSGSYGVGGIVGVNQGSSTNTIVQYAYNTGTVTSSNSNKVGGIVGSNYAIIGNAYSQEGTAAAVSGASSSSATENDVAIKSETDLKKAATFAGFGFKNGVSSDGAWRIYEGQTMPLLTAFMTRKDVITSMTTYDGTADVGASYTDSTYNGAEKQNGINYIKDVTIVKPKDLTITFGNTATRSYDGTTNATAGEATLTGKVGTDDVDLDDTFLTVSYGDKNAGTNKTVNYTGISIKGDKAKNYNLTAITATGQGTINQKTITADFEDITKTYDGTDKAVAGKGTLNDVVEADKDKVAVTANAAYDSKNAGSRTVNYTNVALTGDEAKNYDIATTATGKGLIEQAKVMFSVSDYTRDYDGTTDASGANLSTNGTIFEGDSLTSIKKEFTDKNAGDKKVIKVSDAVIDDGNGGKNYIVDYEENKNSTINRKALSLVADNVTITEGDATPAAFTGQVTGFVGNESLAEGDVPSFAIADPAPTAVGSYAVTGTLDNATSGDYGENYTFDNAAANATAFTIKAKEAPSSGGGGGSTGGNGGNGGGGNAPSNPTEPGTPAGPGTPTGAPNVPTVPETPAVEPTAPTVPDNPANPSATPHDNPAVAGEQAVILGDVMPEMKGTPAANIPLETLREEENTAANLANESRNEAANVANVTREAGLEAGAQEAPFVMEEGTKPVEAAQMGTAAQLAGQEGNASDNGDSDSSDDEKKKKQQAAEE